VRAELADRVVRFEVTETFLNRGGGIAEADYIFPLPPRAAFQDLALYINGEPVTGEAMPADRARMIYESIVRSQKDPALVEWIGHGLLRARIFPIAPGEEKRVTVRFAQVVEREGDALRVDYYRGSSPRMPEPAVRWASDTEAPTRERAGSATFRLRFRPDRGFGRPYSPTHSLRLREDGSWRVAEAEGNASGLTILVPVGRASAGAFIALTHAERDGRHLLLTFTPPRSSRAPIARDVTFVVDVSGSMRGAKLEQARDAGIALLRTLRPEDRFRVVAFSSEAQTFRNSPVFATRENVAAGIRYLESLDPEGGTNIEAALDEALSGPVERDRLGMVVFLTDGLPTAGERRIDRLAEMVNDRRRAMRFFTFGLGADVNVALLEQIAVDGGGTAHFVRGEESVERSVSVLALRLREPVLTDVRLTADGVRLRHVYPAMPTDVFAGEDLVVLAEYVGDGSAQVTLSGQTDGRTVRFVHALQFPERERGNSFVSRLWAARRLGHLSLERRRHGPSPEIDDEIRTLGERYGIPTELSSYLVLEPGVVPPNMPMPARPMDGGARIRQQTGERDLSGRGVAGAAAPAAPTSGNAAFESARRASEQRSMSTLSGVVATGAAGTYAGGARTVRHLGTRTFHLHDNVWIQEGRQPSRERVRVKPYSALYFALLREIEDLREIFSLGERVVVYGRDVTIELHPEGSEAESTATVNQVMRDW
jgi:Ca-activated chloride channel family protein